MATGFPIGSIAGEGARYFIAALGLAVCCFCIAGCANALWHMYWHVPRARRARKRGDRKAYAAAWRRTEPRNGTIAFQLAVGILTFVVTL